MANEVRRLYVEKKPGFDIAAMAIKTDLTDFLKISISDLHLFNRYDIQGVADEKWLDVCNTVLSEPASDYCYEENLPPLSENARLLCAEPLPGQFDVRADSCEQCVQMLLGGKRPVVRAAKVFCFIGISDDDYIKARAYLINPIEYREASFDKPAVITSRGGETPPDIKTIDGFIKLDEDDLETLRQRLGLAMSHNDLLAIRDYFRSEQRDPTFTELCVIDTYWSDHCRHTTFNTQIISADILDERVQKSYNSFLRVNKNSPVTLMRIATAAMKHLRDTGKLPMLDVSQENNACTIRVNAEFEHGREDWLLFFKNETHNHPTEIEPFGGAATCIGGAIRDPLSGRGYVYQAMRVTGAGDPRRPIDETLPGKLPQRKLTLTAASGFSSYGNQIGLATGIVKEFYHEGYIAKRLETGAVVGAAPVSFVRRCAPSPGDAVVILGGRTGRDGIGGATGSSKTHNDNTVSQSASEVQKGNAPEERKLQRLFRDPNVTKLIKRCNDFGAGGVCVAIGELSGGVLIDLDKLPVKYDGLDGTELAISESQERMAVVVDKSDVKTLFAYAGNENIEAVEAARITDNNRLQMIWRGRMTVDISRDFLDSFGAKRETEVYVPPVPPAGKKQNNAQLYDKLIRLAGDLNFCSQKGLVERFDSSIGAASVFMPHGGKYALTQAQVMAAVLPAPGAKTASVMAYGFDPALTQADPFGGSEHAVITSVAKLVAAGVALDTIHLSLQEYFPRVNDSAARWGLPFAALLGAFQAQMGLEIAAIGGKDSMSGSFGAFDVPPTLISFAVGISDASRLISPEFKKAGSPLYLLDKPRGGNETDYRALLDNWKRYLSLCAEGMVLSAWAVETGGIYGGVMKMAFGNKIGFCGAEDELYDDDIRSGAIIFEAAREIKGCRLLGRTQDVPEFTIGKTTIPLTELIDAWEKPLEEIFPTRTPMVEKTETITDSRQPVVRKGMSIAKPLAVIPVFPGTNCEYDTEAAIARAGGASKTVLVRNLTPDMLEDSIKELEKAILQAQMIIFPGGFSGADEPDGAAKFIVSLFKNPRLRDAVCNLTENRDGLILGICNGFQALLKLGLLTADSISPTTDRSPTLTFNRIGRHQARYVITRVSSVFSPWMSRCKPGETYLQPVSHGEGRFIAPPEVLNELKANGQIVFQYADYNGTPSMDIGHNPNGSALAIEGIVSPNGRILGKMAHTERYSKYAAQNIPGNKFLPLFEGAADYFR